MQYDPILTTFDTTPSLHWRINAPGSLLAFAHIHGEAGTPTVGIRSAMVSRNGPILCAERVDFHSKRPHSRCIRHHPVSALANQCSWFASGLFPYPLRGRNTSCGCPECVVSRNGPVLCAERVAFLPNDPILAAFDTTPSPHWRINAAGLIMAFAHIHGEAGTPAVGTRSVVGRNGPVLCMRRKSGFPFKTTPFSLHSTPPRLRIGESMQLV
jgi:hypothetical protein